MVGCGRIWGTRTKAVPWTTVSVTFFYISTWNKNSFYKQWCLHMVFIRKIFFGKKKSFKIHIGCPTTYSCHVDSVLLNSKFKANQSKYWNSKFKYSQIEYSNIFRRTWCFQISFLIFEDSKIGRWHFPSLHS
jgi:hypothetical protein